MDGPVRRAAALPSEARELSLLSPVLDFRLREYQVENQAHHVNGCHEEEYFEPGGFRVLGDESAGRLRAVGTAAGFAASASNVSVGLARATQHVCGTHWKTLRGSRRFTLGKEAPLVSLLFGLHLRGYDFSSVKTILRCASCSGQKRSWFFMQK